MSILDVNTLKKIIFHTPGNVYLKDVSGAYILCNSNMLKLFGLSSVEEIINKTDYDFCPFPIAEYIRQIDEQVIQSKVEQTIEEEGFNDKRENAIYLTKKVPLYTETGEFYALLGISFDITEQKEIAKLKAEKEKTDQLLKEMQAKLEGMTHVSACVAHELRTPLAAVSMGLNNIKKYFPLLIESYKAANDADLSVPKINKQAFQVLSEVPLSMERVVQSAFLFIDMLLMNLQPSLHNTAEHTAFSINQCISMTLETYPFTEEERMLVNWSEDHEKDFEVHGKALLVKHVLYNLIKNALYYIAKANKGKITIWTEKGNKFNFIYFKDTGSGISSTVLPKIFERFFSLSHYSAGIGLTFCKLAMESLAGKIHCESEEGEYTLFRLDFPANN